MSISDAELVTRAIEDDSSAFRELVERYKGIVYGLSYHLIGDFDAALDVSQEVFFHAYKNLKSLKEREKFAGWLYRITYNCCSNWRRKQDSRPVSLDQLRENGAEIGISGSQHGFSIVEMQAENNLVRQRILDEINSLPEIYREVVVLHYLEDIPCRKIAKFLDTSLSNVKVKLHRARKLLRDKLKDLYDEKCEDEEAVEENEVQIRQINIRRIH